jgi:hypothetical protein
VTDHPELPFDLEERALEPRPDAPQVYVACALTSIRDDPERQRLIDAEIQLIQVGINRASTEAAVPWPVRIHAPIEWSAPWRTPETTPTDVHDANARIVLGQSDALIVHGHQPSEGVGQEFAWALAVGVPVLHLCPIGQHVSRQIAGTPGDVTIASPGSAMEIVDRTCRWVRSRRRLIEGGPARRKDRLLLHGPVRAALLEAWQKADDTSRRALLSYTRLTEPRLLWILSDDAFLATAPFHQIQSLAVGLRIVLPPFRTAPPPELTTAQFRAFLAASDEYDWDVHTAELVKERARSELAKGGVRRFRLDSIPDWLRIRRLIG